VVKHIISLNKVTAIEPLSLVAFDAEVSGKFDMPSANHHSLQGPLTAAQIAIPNLARSLCDRRAKLASWVIML
jgi:hypothetical protein